MSSHTLPAGVYAVNYYDDVIDPADLIDSTEVAAIVGLNRGGNVSLYRQRYEDFPAPVVSKGRCMLWLRPEVEAWVRSRGKA
jgi:predicted DNA-binding transcriptional regulator AlpA